MTPSNGIVEIRTLAELLSLYEIASDSTLTKDQYRNPLRPYRLIQPEASCQYQKNGKRCFKCISTASSLSGTTIRRC